MKKALLTLCSVMLVCMMTGCNNQKNNLPELEGVSLSEKYDDFVKAFRDKGFRVGKEVPDKTIIEGTFKKYGDCLYTIHKGVHGDVKKVTLWLGHPMPDYIGALSGYELLKTDMEKMIGVPAKEMGAIKEHIVKVAFVKTDDIEAVVSIEYYNNDKNSYVVMCDIYCD